MRRLFRLVQLDRPLPPVLLPICGALLAVTIAARTPAQAQSLLPPSIPVSSEQKTQTFVIPASEGYGVIDCLRGGADCGRVVADAWCEANGLAKATGWGSADDMTASAAGRAQRPATDSVIITCVE